MQGNQIFIIVSRNTATNFAEKVDWFFEICIPKTKSRDSSVGKALGYRLDDRGSRGSIPGRGWEFFSSLPRPERLWGSPSLLSNG
jgi:hypothetical protein